MTHSGGGTVRLPEAVAGYRVHVVTKRLKPFLPAFTFAHRAEHTAVDLAAVGATYAPAPPAADAAFPQLMSDPGALIDEHGAFVPVRLASGAIVAGVWTKTAGVSTPVFMAIHPTASGIELLRLTEKDRTRATLKCYTRTKLVEGQSVIEHLGEKYTVMVEVPYGLQAGVYIYLAVKEQ